MAAIGTIAATITAVCLAFDGRRSKLSAALVMARSTCYTAVLVINNYGNKPVIVKQVDYSYKGIKYTGTDFFNSSDYREHIVFLPDKTKELTVRTPQKLYNSLKSKEDNATKENSATLSPKYLKESSKKHKLTIIITDINNHKYKSHQKYSERELLSFMFGEQLFS